MTFDEKLRTLKKALKKNSILTYLRNIRRLRKVFHELPIPASDSAWLTEKRLFTWFDKQPLNIRRHMATAGQIALAVYKKPSEQWKKRQKNSMREFDDERKERKLSDKQRNKIPPKGFAALRRVVTNMRRELRHILGKPTTEWDRGELLRVQNLVILSLYSDHPLRLDYASLEIGKSEKNCIYKNRRKPKGWHVQLVDFKTGKSLGTQVFKPNATNQRLLNKFIPAVERLTKHKHLLTNRSGTKMSRQVLSKRLTTLTKHRLGKGFSVQLLRILFAMHHRKVLESAKEVSKKLLHSQEQSLQYAKKD